MLAAPSGGGREHIANAFRKERERLDREDAADKKSLAATERQLNSDGTLLRLALELADDVAAVHWMADSQPKRALNQAFYKRIKVVGRRDRIPAGGWPTRRCRAEQVRCGPDGQELHADGAGRGCVAGGQTRKQKAAPMGPPSFGRC